MEELAWSVCAGMTASSCFGLEDDGFFPPSTSLTGHLKEEDLWGGETFIMVFYSSFPFALVQMKALGPWAVSVCAVQGPDFCQPRP